MKYYTFTNVTISLRAKSGKEAYSKLCDQLAKNDGDWYTDTYYVEDGEVRPTSEVFPRNTGGN